MNASMMMWSVLFGAIGMGYFVYGKRQRAIVPLCIGLALIVFPYFVASVTCSGQLQPDTFLKDISKSIGD
ncbi:hypothetical protein ACWXWU_19225 [Shewanella sp. A14]